MTEAPQPSPSGAEPPSSGDQPPTSGDQPGGSGGSRSLWLAVAIGLGAIVLAIILYLLLRPDDEPAANTTSSEAQPTTIQTTTQVTTTQETTTVATTTVETTTTAPADQPVRVNVRFENGEVVGGLVTADIQQGEQVVLTVRADVTDEVHLHGYDLTADVAPGQPGRITFRADEVGVFEAELEELGIPIAELSVSE